MMPDEKLSPLPPLHPLRAFHAAARFGRFRDAASALRLSESAVSHQVRKLESYLGVALFERAGNAVRLSLAGQAYFEAIDPAFQRIRKATEDLAGPCCRVSLTLPTSLATLWLIPRLAQLEASFPEVNLQMIPTGRLCDLRREQIDLAIRYGVGGWGGVVAHHLFDEQAFPVCRPGLLGEDVEPQAVLNTTRLIVNGGRTEDSRHTEEWREWAQAHGLKPPSLQGALVVKGSDQVLEAAAQGLGLGIGRRPMVDRWLKDGRLLAPFGVADESGCAYFLVYPEDVELSLPVRRVARWLINLCGGETPPGLA